MNAYLNYAIEANLGLIFFSVIYFLLLHRETQFNVKRAYLLGAMLASVVFPLIEFTTTQPIIPSIGSVTSIIYLPEINVRAAASSATASITINYWNITIGIYALVASALLLLFCVRIGKLMFLLKATAFVQEGKFRIIESNTNHPTFSFFHYIFIGNANQLSQSEKDQIVNHEKLHASRVHSLDLLVSEILRIAFWFNPIVYVMKNQLVSIHEFEADQQAVQHQDPDLYCDLLARTSLTSAGFSLANHFHNSLTLKRILMINAKKTKIKGWKYFMLIPAFAIGIVAISCQDQVKSEISETVKSARAIVPLEISNKVKELQKANPDREYVIAEATEEGAKVLLDELSNSADKSKSEIISILRFESDKNPNEAIRKFIVIVRGTKDESLRQQSAGDNSQAASSNPDNDKIYMVVEQDPSFPGGPRALAKFFSNELHYPDQARKKGVQGKVFVKFVVDENGKVTDPTVLKGIGAGCDAEALRVVTKFPNWNPGKQEGKPVKVRFVVPINFTLD